MPSRILTLCLILIITSGIANVFVYTNPTVTKGNGSDDSMMIFLQV